MPGHWGEIPLAAVILCLVSGITLGSIVVHYNFALFALGSISLIGAALIALCRNLFAIARAAGLSTIIVAGLMLALAQRDSRSDSDVRGLLSRGLLPLNEAVSFDGCTAGDSEKRGAEAVAVIDLHGFRNIDGWIPAKGKALIWMPGSVAGEKPAPVLELREGDRVRGWATWKLPRNYLNPGSADRVAYLSRKGIFILGNVKSQQLLEVLPGDCSSWWMRLAASVRDRVRKCLGPIRENGKSQAAAILASLIIGDYTDLDTTTREAFQNAGVYHVLVVSGLHVAWIAGVLLHLLQMCRIPREPARLTVAAVIFLYARVVGFQASITRCLWTFILYLVGQALFRRALPANILLASGVCLLAARPNWLFDGGFQLSFLSVLAISLTALPIVADCIKPLTEPVCWAGKSERLFLQPGAWARRGRMLRTRVELWAESCIDRQHDILARMLIIGSRTAARSSFALGSMLLISAAVQLWIEPLLANNFNRLSWISPIANLLIVPFSSLVLAAGIASALAPDIWSMADSFSALAARLAELMLALTKLLAAVPLAWQRCPTPSCLWVAGGILLLFIGSLLRRRAIWFPSFYVGILLFCLACGGVPGLDGHWFRNGLESGSGDGALSSDKPVLSLTFLDVGEGDSIVIRFPDGQVWVLDAGGIWQSQAEEDSAYIFDIGEAVVGRYLWQAWITRLDRIILSHPDRDHAGGIQALINNFAVKRLDYAETPGDVILDKILTAAREHLIQVMPVGAGNNQLFGSVLVRTLNPPNEALPRSTNENSIVLHLTHNRFSALLTGDLEKAAEARLVTDSENLHSLLLKVAHHGSRYGTREQFLNKVSPRWAVISVGRNNPFGHPSPEVVARLLHHRVRPLLTMDEGAITFETDGSDYLLRSFAGGVLERGFLSKDFSIGQPQN